VKTINWPNVLMIFLAASALLTGKELAGILIVLTVMFVHFDSKLK